MPASLLNSSYAPYILMRRQPVQKARPDQGSPKDQLSILSSENCRKFPREKRRHKVVSVAVLADEVVNVDTKHLGKSAQTRD